MPANNKPEGDPHQDSDNQTNAPGQKNLPMKERATQPVTIETNRRGTGSEQANENEDQNKEGATDIDKK